MACQVKLKLPRRGELIWHKHQPVLLVIESSLRRFGLRNFHRSYRWLEREGILTLKNTFGVDLQAVGSLRQQEVRGQLRSRWQTPAQVAEINPLHSLHDSSDWELGMVPQGRAAE